MSSLTSCSDPCPLTDMPLHTFVWFQAFPVSSRVFLVDLLDEKVGQVEKAHAMSGMVVRLDAYKVWYSVAVMSTLRIQV